MRRQGFDRIARAYRWLEYLSFGGALERCREARLHTMANARRAIVLGDGDGRFTAALLRANTHLAVVALDASPEMVRLLVARVQRLGALDRLTTITGALPGLLSGPLPAQAQMQLRPSFDLVVSHFFLDCLSTVEVAELAAALAPRLGSGAQWIVSEFAAPSLWAKAVVASLYWAFGRLTGLKQRQLPAWEQSLSGAGFTCLDRQTSLCGLLISSVWVLREPKGNQAHPASFP